MNFLDYQSKALLSDKIPSSDDGNQFIVPLLGLAGEAGQLLTEYKKQLRDGASNILFKERVVEELGDLLWYIANLASKFELDLDYIATQNLYKCQNRWIEAGTEITDIEANTPQKERLPRKFTVKITEDSRDNKVTSTIYLNDEQIGNNLTDNNHLNDGYRFHDVFHFAYAAVLGWSPVTRKLLKCKRSDPDVDEVEDGGRAKAIEEGIAALVFSYARDHSFLEGISTIDDELLKRIQGMTSHLDVACRSLLDWQKAILLGFNIWREVNQNFGGTITVDLDLRSISYSKE
jgi:NTP pyrophosphatase (non-canonical NTP hydrolase)